MKKETQKTVITRINANWEASITLTLPIATLDKIARKADKMGVRPCDLMKTALNQLATAKA